MRKTTEGSWIQDPSIAYSIACQTVIQQESRRFGEPEDSESCRSGEPENPDNTSTDTPEIRMRQVLTVRT